MRIYSVPVTMDYPNCQRCLSFLLKAESRRWPITCAGSAATGEHPRPPPSIAEGSWAPVYEARCGDTRFLLNEFDFEHYSQPA